MNQEGPDSGPGPSTNLALKNELALALLHTGHGLLGFCLGLILSHHFHACCHLGHHGACVGSGIEAHIVWPRPRHLRESGRDKRADQNGCDNILPHFLSPCDELGAEQRASQKHILWRPTNQLFVDGPGIVARHKGLARLKISAASWRFVPSGLVFFLLVTRGTDPPLVTAVSMYVGLGLALYATLIL
jgi:hypothetical protein